MRGVHKLLIPLFLLIFVLIAFNALLWGSLALAFFGSPGCGT